MSKPRSLKAPIALSEAPPPVTIELFASFAEAKAASSDTAAHAEQILAIASIDGPEQEAWTVERGREIQATRKAIDERQRRWLKPVKEIEAMIKGFDTVVFRGEPIAAEKLLEKCSRHLAGLMDGARSRAAAAQAALLPAARSAEEVTAALAVLQPKPAGWVEREEWGWRITDIAKIPADYFVLDVARLQREVDEHKHAFNVPGVEATVEKKGHFRS
jgi:hypothetical protein